MGSKVDTQVRKMCSDILTSTDMKAIAAARNFDKQSLLSRDRFEKYFYSVVGLQNAIDSLTHDERIFLYYMGDEWVDVKFFSPLYKPADEKKYQYDTYTRKYTDVYKCIQNNLIRKGVLIVRESYGDSKLERLRFNIPDLFLKYIPGPFIEKNQINAEIVVDETRLRNKISECLTEKNNEKKSDGVYIKNCKLYFGEKNFCLESIYSWQQNKWYHSCLTSEIKQSKNRNDVESKLTKYLAKSFQALDSQYWVQPVALQPLLNFIYYPNEPIESEKVFIAGYSLGCLRRASIDGKTYYSCANLLNQDEEYALRPDYYLEPMNNGFLIDLKKIPYTHLAALVKYGSFSKHKNKLLIIFEFNALTKMNTAFIESPLLSWIRQKNRLLDEQVKQIQIKHGKILLHQNILIAKVNDLRLKAYIIKAYENVKDIIFLPNDFIVFPKAMRSEFDKLIKKAGYAIKTKVVNATK